jgi:hypothetical protein
MLVGKSLRTRALAGLALWISACLAMGLILVGVWNFETMGTHAPAALLGISIGLAVWAKIHQVASGRSAMPGIGFLVSCFVLYVLRRPFFAIAQQSPFAMLVSALLTIALCIYFGRELLFRRGQEKR